MEYKPKLKQTVMLLKDPFANFPDTQADNVLNSTTVCTKQLQQLLSLLFMFERF